MEAVERGEGRKTSAGKGEKMKLRHLITLLNESIVKGLLDGDMEVRVMDLDEPLKHNLHPILHVPDLTVSCHRQDNLVVLEAPLP